MQRHETASSHSAAERHKSARQRRARLKSSVRRAADMREHLRGNFPRRRVASRDSVGQESDAWGQRCSPL